MSRGDVRAATPAGACARADTAGSLRCPSGARPRGGCLGVDPRKAPESRMLPSRERRESATRPARCWPASPLQYIAPQIAAEPAVDELESARAGGLPLLEQAGDHAGLFHVWEALGGVANFRGRYDDWAYAAEQAIEHGRLVGRHPRASSDSGRPSFTVQRRPTRRCEDSTLRCRSRLAPSVADRACLLATLARFGEAAGRSRGRRKVDEFTRARGPRRTS